MPTLEERVAYLEGKNEDAAGAVSEVRTDVRELRTDVRDLRGEVRELRSEINRRFEQVDVRFAQVDTKFIWLIGLQFATLLAVISVILGAHHR
jgi:chromosome segregation ATPase